ncbi:hypothetical protein [Thermococcus piezophilus]|uniref:hypothetical protein n=1 Tax=Thermococcus piezophilus TaxID=1712654 RepID=UPI000A633AC6|nr:hypothetical protein [Thermococcus piezophilus]
MATYLYPSSQAVPGWGGEDEVTESDFEALEEYLKKERMEAEAIKFTTDYAVRVHFYR